MSSQVLRKQTNCAQAFVALLRAHASTTSRLNAQLSADHGLTINDFEVLLRLARAPDRRMRRVDLAQETLLTASGITRLLDGLERAGWVERAACATDRRVVYAVVTETGLSKLQVAAETHFAQIDELFEARFDADQLASLTSLLARLGDREPSDADCEPPAS